MKKLIFALLILGIAAPTAWGLYSSRAPVRAAAPAPAESPQAPPPAVAERGSLPWMVPLDRFNDWAIALKRRINAYIRRDRRVAEEGWAGRCLPRIGEGLYASARRMRGDRVTAVAGKIYNVSDADHAPALYMLKLYDNSGALIRTAETRLGGIKAHTAQAFRTVLRVPGVNVHSVVLAFDPALAHH